MNEIASGAVPEPGLPTPATNGRGPDNVAPSAAAEDSRPVTRSRIHAFLRPLSRWARSAEGQSTPLTRDEATAWSSWDELRDELDRSRRYGRCFTLVRLTCPRSETVGQAEPGDERVRVLDSLLRGVDSVWAHGENLYVLLPECDREMAEAMLARIREPLSERLHGEETGVACFPEDGVASGALLAALHGRSVRPQRPVLQAAEAPEGGEVPSGTAA